MKRRNKNAISFFLLVMLTNPIFGIDSIVIDPGHPSETSAGSQLIDGLREVDVN